MHTKTLLPPLKGSGHSYTSPAHKTIEQNLTHSESEAASPSCYVGDDIAYEELKKHCFTELLILRGNLLEASNDCKGQWELLEQYITQHYPTHLHQILLKLVGSELFSNYVKNNCDDLKQMLSLGWRFIKENETEISNSGLLPSNFIENYKLTYSSFLKAFKQYHAKTLVIKQLFLERRAHNCK